MFGQDMISVLGSSGSDMRTAGVPQQGQVLIWNGVLAGAGTPTTFWDDFARF